MVVNEMNKVVKKPVMLLPETHKRIFILKAELEAVDADVAITTLLNEHYNQ